MNKLRITLFIVTLIIISATYVIAQNTERTTITVENVADIAQIADIQFSSNPNYAFTSDNQWLIADTEADIQVFSLAELDEISTPVANITGASYRLSSDGNWLLILTDTELQFFDFPNIAASSDPVASFEYTGNGRTVRFSSNNQWLAVVSSGSITLFDMATFNADSTEPVVSIVGTRFSFNPDSTQLAVYDQAASELKLFDLASSALEDTSDTVIATGSHSNFSFNRSGTVLVFNSDNGVEFWDIATAQGSSYEWDKPTNFATRVFSPDDRYVALSSGSCSPGYCFGEIRVIDSSTLEDLYSTTYDDSFATALAFSGDGSLLAYGISVTGSWTVGQQRGTSFENGIFYVIDIETGEEIITNEEEYGILGSILFTDDNQSIIYTSIRFVSQFPEWGTATIHVVNSGTGEEEQTFAGKGLASSINAENSNHLRSANIVRLPGTVISSGGPHILDLATGDDIYEGISLSDAVFNQDLSLTVNARYNRNEATGTLRFYDSETHDILSEFEMTEISGFSSVHLSSDESLVGVEYNQGASPDTIFHIVLFGI